MTQWTQEQIDLAVKLRGEGLSAATIAQQLGSGFSRSAVLGKFHRMGVAPSAAKKWAAIRAKMQRVDAPAPLKSEVAEAKRQIEHPLEMNPVTLLKRGPDQCCFPLGEPRSEAFRYCGATKREGSDYCAPHQRIMYQPRTERPKLQNPSPSRVTRDMRGDWA